MNEVIAALLGAICAGAFRMIVDFRQKGEHRQAVLRAIAGEVAVICLVVRLQYGPQHFLAVAQRVEAGERITLPLDLKENYFVTYEALVGEMGRLSAEQTATIAQFYTFCKVAIDTMRPDSPYFGSVRNLRFTASVAARILALGDQIVQFPDKQIAQLKLA